MDLLKELFSAGVWGKESPTIPEWVKWIHRNLSDKHCPTCLKLDGCWFLKEKAPPCPHHPYCHCVLQPIDFSQVEKNAKTYCPYSKFDPYLFDPYNYYKHGENKAFESWGYTVADSNWLKVEFEKQALEKYIVEDYELGLLNERGQRINIRTEIPRKDRSGTISFITGWMIYPNGYIQLTTPYGGK